MQIYILILYVKSLAQNKNDSINSILQHACVVENTFCGVFFTSRFPYLILCEWKVTTTYLAIRTKNN